MTKKKLTFFCFILINAIFLVYISFLFLTQQITEEKIALENLSFVEYLITKNHTPDTTNTAVQDYIRLKKQSSIKTNAIKENLERDFAIALEIRKYGTGDFLSDILDRLRKIKNKQVREEIGNSLVCLAIIGKDYDAALSAMNFSKKSYEWFVWYTYLYYKSEKKSFLREDYLIYKNEGYYKLKNRLNKKQTWGMVCSMPHFLRGGLYNSSSETSVLAFDDYKHFLKTGINDFSRSLSRYKSDYPIRRTFESAKVLSGFLYLAGDLDKCEEIYNTINNPNTKIQAAALIINLALANNDIVTARNFAKKISPLQKIRIYFFI